MMMLGPATLKEAQRHRYGCWAGAPNGQPYHSGDCIAEIIPANERGPVARQCSRKATTGPEGAWCPAHAPGHITGGYHVYRVTEEEVQCCRCQLRTWREKAQVAL